MQLQVLRIYKMVVNRTKTENKLCRSSFVFYTLNVLGYVLEVCFASRFPDGVSKLVFIM